MLVVVAVLETVANHVQAVVKQVVLETVEEAAVELAADYSTETGIIKRKAVYSNK